MAKAIIKLMPTRQQLVTFGYSYDEDIDSYKSTWDFLAKTFTGTPIECELMGVARYTNDFSIGLWVDGICIPYEWCTVTALTDEEAEILREYRIKYCNANAHVIRSFRFDPESMTDEKLEWLVGLIKGFIRDFPNDYKETAQ